MSDTWSPSRLGNTTSKLPRHLFEVTKEQEELLNRSDSWRKPHLPASVLEIVKSQHPAPAPNLSLPQAPFQTWSPSSPTTIPKQLRQVPSDQQKILCGPDIFISPTAPPKWQGLAAAVTSSPTSQQTKEPQLAEVAKLPLLSSSMDDSEEEVGVQDPKGPAHRDAEKPESRATAVHVPPGPTPPSAQVIPSTYPEPASVGSPQQQKRWRPMKNASKSLNPAELLKEPSRPFILSLTKTTNSPRAASSPVSPTSSEIVSPMVQPVVKPIALRGGAQPESNGSSDKPPPNVPASQDPFNVFKQNYPDYDGSLGDFVRGVLSLIPLQKKKTVPQYILDDYIRVFSGDYLDYIGQLRDDQRPLTTWEWYCDNVPRPVYTKGVVSSHNLKDIRRRYPDKVVAIEAQSTPAQVNARQPDLQHTCRSDVFSTPGPANNGQQVMPQNQVSGPPFPHHSPEPPLMASKLSVHAAELASDPISTAEDLSFETQPRLSNRRSTGTNGPATKFISATAGWSHARATRPVSMTASRISSSNIRLETQVNFPSLETTSYGSSVWNHEDDAMESVEGPGIEGHLDEVVTGEHMPPPSLESNPGQAAAGIINPRIKCRLSDENSVVGIQRPWEAIGDPEEQQAVQQQCFATFLAELWGPQHTKGRHVGSVR
ncbi:hypothetical protein QBC40DRAFT_321688 [Triangularia verruculosa]|uniref:Uncharacterized protein n=1 Tax=Triangularia verruculosa TaxID=2587418 RepID=A0AAN6XKP7_9PEZI|nr:hypothetical protein QBC40DRAFT_321688 [Triangularia verruculosa]